MRILKGQLIARNEDLGLSKYKCPFCGVELWVRDGDLAWTPCPSCEHWLEDGYFTDNRDYFKDYLERKKELETLWWQAEGKKRVRKKIEKEFEELRKTFLGIILQGGISRG